MSVFLVAGCGGGDEGAAPEGEPAEEVAASFQAPADTVQEVARRFLPDEMRRATRAETFPHTAHAEIDCGVCHEAPRGHDAHSSVDCAACHRASASVTLRSLSPAECQACHHDSEQALSCEGCHTAPGTELSAQRLALEVWSAPRSRTLAFDHERHVDLGCQQCHRAGPDLEPEGCAACHESHHLATSNCQSCHTQPPAGAHDVDAHLTCSGSGCHRASGVEAISDTRAVCLVCHQEQASHEPDGQCVECHAVRPASRAGRDR